MTEIKRLHSLDAARGIAALAVVLWHWQHVYLLGGGKLTDPTMQPFYDVLFVFYRNGWLAVEFFFTLSGFVFFWLYGQRIADRSLGFGSFWLARFSRLYPLHFVTLIAIALMQMLLMANGHESFVYGGTNVPNFVLNLLFLQYFAPGWTFNGPEWSVGVEILLYMLFFIYCRLVRPDWWVLLVVVTLAGVGIIYWQWTLGRGVIGFFAGGVVYEAWRHLRDKPLGKMLALPLLGLVIAMWVYCAVEVQTQALSKWLSSFGLVGWAVVTHVFRLVVVPLTVLALALHESRGAPFWQKISPLGDLTYAIYLWHFPLQLLMALGVTFLAVPVAPLQSPLGMVGFFAVLIGVSILSYRYIERPAQNWLRTRFSPRRAAVEKTA